MVSAQESLAQNLKRLRKDRGLTQAALAEAIEISLRSYQKYEQQEAFPDDKNLDRLAHTLGISVADLFGSPLASARPSASVMRQLVEASLETLPYLGTESMIGQFARLGVEARATVLAILFGDASIAAPYSRKSGKVQGSK